MIMDTTAFDLVVRNGRVVSKGQVLNVDVGVRNGQIVALEHDLPAGHKEVDANGQWVLPGGIDSHCHIEQLSGMGVMGADDFYSGTVSAAFGGTTTIIPFAAQHRGASIPEVLADYSRRAAEKAVIDYGFHLILTTPDEQALKVDLPNAIRSGITSLKVYMTYNALKLDDHQLLDVLDLATREGALVMMHAENHDMIVWLANKLLQAGHIEPKYHAVAHDPLAETEATNRAISLGRLIDAPILIVHVAGGETVEVIRQARERGARVYAESCPQYLFLTAEDLDQDGLEGAKFCCSPPPRDEASQAAIWRGFQDGTLVTYSSDHAPYRFDKSGKLPKGQATTFKEVANGVPGLELRMPLMFSEGYLKGRMDIHEFVDLTATNHARMYGLYPRKGVIEIGADADLALWDENKEQVVRYEMLHDEVGYTPYEGKVVKGWPTVVINRGRVVVENNELLVERGSGEFLARKAPDLVPIQGGGGVQPEPRARTRFLKKLLGHSPLMRT